MAISRAQLMKELLPGLNALFGMEYSRYPEEWRSCYEVENSDRAFEEETKLSGFGTAPVKDEGAAIAYDDAQEVYTARYTHEAIAMGFSITQEAVEDNLYDSLSARYTKALARAFQNTKEVKGAALFNEGFTGQTGGDGKSLFATDHPLVSGGTNANEPSVAVDLNETALEAAIIAIGKWTDERGLKIAARPKKLLIPSDLQFVAERLMKTDGRVGSADNDLNAVKSMSAVPGGYMVNHYLTDTDAWFLGTDIPNGFKHFSRVAMKTSMEGDFETGNVRYKGRERYSFGYSDPLAYYGSPGA
jgi:hypothetical protein|tara:strand:- start:4863 stop:5768 length:906 start_codon:yes stop_codon:yes gene_type:complete